MGKFIEKEELFHQEAHLLCAVSGGMDSMVMLDAIKQRGFKVSVAHVNYMLRGTDSIEDQKLVESYCKQHNIPCYVKVLSSEEVKEIKDANLQEKARNIRYQWFDQLVQQHHLDYTCIAHHQDDVAETFLLNAMRTSGLVGLSSIKHTNGIVRRPLLNSSKSSIQEYATLNKVAYREDLSNADNKYDRNFIRNEILTKLESRWSQATTRIFKSTDHLQQDLNLLQSLIKKEKENWFEENANQFKFGPIDQFRKQSSAQSLAFHLFRKYEFSFEDIQMMIFENHPNGAYFSNSNYECIVDRNHILIRKKKVGKLESKQINTTGHFNLLHGSFSIEATDINKSVQDVHIEHINADHLKWPITVRNWQKGDTLQPLGMNGRQKKVSDILIDQKAHRFDKEEQYVVVDGSGSIIWLIGRKLSDQFKITKATNSILKLAFVPKKQ